MNEGDIMKLAIILVALLIVIGGFLILQYGKSALIKNSPAISGTQELIPNEQDLQQLGMTRNLNQTELQQLGITSNVTNCWTDEQYTNIIDSSVGQYSICSYIIDSLDDTKLIIKLQKFANYESLDGSYQYSSSHLYSIEGIISENDYGDHSLFRVNNVNDYGGQFDEPGVYFYHLWICKDLYLIHITSSGRSKDAEDYVARIGQQILSKFNK